MPRILEAWNTRADLYAEAIEAAEQRGFVQGIEAAVGWHDEQRRKIQAKIDADDTVFTQDVFGARCAGHALDAESIRALSPTPPAPQPLPENHNKITPEELLLHFGDNIPMNIAMIIADNHYLTALGTRRAINLALTEQEGE
jgi:hypothetical protein